MFASGPGVCLGGRLAGQRLRPQRRASLVNTLNDGTNEPYTAGSAFDAVGNFYVTDDLNGTISEYAPDGTFDGTFATGLTNPLSLVFDNQGNLYVGQQGTPYIAEFNSKRPEHRQLRAR